MFTFWADFGLFLKVWPVLQCHHFCNEGGYLLGWFSFLLAFIAPISFYPALISSGSYTNCHRPIGGLNNKHLFLTALEALKSKIKVPADLVLGEVLFLICRWLCFPWISDGGKQRERERSGISSPFYKDINPIISPLPSWSHLPQITSQRRYHQIPWHWGLRFQHVNLGGHKLSLHNTPTLLPPLLGCCPISPRLWSQSARTGVAGSLFVFLSL